MCNVSCLIFLTENFLHYIIESFMQFDLDSKAPRRSSLYWRHLKLTSSLTASWSTMLSTERGNKCITRNAKKIGFICLPQSKVVVKFVTPVELYGGLAGSWELSWTVKSIGLTSYYLSPPPHLSADMRGSYKYWVRKRDFLVLSVAIVWFCDVTVVLTSSSTSSSFYIALLQHSLGKSKLIFFRLSYACF